MSYEFFFLPKHHCWENSLLTSQYLIFSLKTVQSSTLKDPMAEVGRQSDVLHQLKLRRATLSGGNDEEGA